MPALSEPREWLVGSQYFGPAIVLDEGAFAGTVRVRLGDGAGECETMARVALAPAAAIGEGDAVLVAGQDVDDLYVIGVLRQARAPEPPLRRIDIGGAFAMVDGPPEAGTLRVFSKEQRLLYEYDASTGRSRVTAERGDLEFVTADGDITMHSGRDIRLVGRAIVLDGRTGIQLAVGGAAERLRSCLTLLRNGAKLACRTLRMDAERGAFHVEDASFAGRTLQGTVSQVRWVAERIETVAGTIVQKARNLYRKVEELAQLSAGRMRVLVGSTLHLKARTVCLKSERDFKVQGEKIHLG